MSEYQYYEFQAIDRPLDAREQEALRGISSRASISAHHFQNHYSYGDLRADPIDMLGRYFDVFLYYANWGDRQFAMRLPKRLVDAAALDRSADVASITVADTPDHIIVHLWPEGLEAPDWIDAEGLLDTLAPLRAEVLAGDLRFGTLMWLLEVEAEDFVEDDVEEPEPSLAGMSDTLRALADFFAINADLVEAAAGGPAAAAEPIAAVRVREWLERLPDDEKLTLLQRLHDGDDPLLGAELRLRVRRALAPVSDAGRPRTAGELRAAARKIAAERERAAAAAEETRRQQEAERRAAERAFRLAALRERGERAWRDVEDLIARRNPKGYEGATELLLDLAALAQQEGALDHFRSRLGRLRASHQSKGRFIERLDAANLMGDLGLIDYP